MSYAIGTGLFNAFALDIACVTNPDYGGPRVRVNGFKTSTLARNKNMGTMSDRAAAGSARLSKGGC
jgi:hypothetical protein